MSVSADDKISIGPEFQAVIPKLQDKTLKKPSTRKPNLIWRPTPASLKDCKDFVIRIISSEPISRQP